MSSIILRLPQDIFHFLVNYLHPVSQQNKKTFIFSLDWRNLMNTNRKHFHTWKKKHLLLVLPHRYAHGYQTDQVLRDHVLSLIENPKTQLVLRFDFPINENGIYDNEFDLSIFSGVKSLTVSHCKLVCNSPVAVEEAVFESCSISNSVLSKITTKRLRLFHVTGDDQFLSFEENVDLLESLYFWNEYQACDYSSFCHLKEVNFLCCDFISTVACFKNVHILALCNCPCITDVSMLGNVKKLDLSQCEGITDVSALGRVHTLLLSHCINISDVSALGKVYHLELNWCRNVKDVSQLHHVHTLFFHEFTGTDLSGLRNVVKLDISFSKHLSDITMLSKVEELDISYCTQIKDFSGLENLRKFTFFAFETSLVVNKGRDLFQRLKHVSVGPVKDMEKMMIYLIRNTSLESLHLTSNANLPYYAFRNLKKLKLTDYPNIVDEFPSNFTQLQSLEIHNCHNFIYFPESLPSLGYLHISGCTRLVSLIVGEKMKDIKYPVYEMKIEDCLALKEIVISRKCFKVNISKCQVLEELKALAQINYCHIRHCESFLGTSNTQNVISLSEG
jgi:hypothetical protein